jgi:hypothetical protein
VGQENHRLHSSLEVTYLILTKYTAVGAVPEWPRGAGRDPAGHRPRRFEPFRPHYCLFLTKPLTWIPLSYTQKEGRAIYTLKSGPLSPHSHAYRYPGLAGVDGMHLFRSSDTGSGLRQQLPRRCCSTDAVEYRDVRKRLRWLLRDRSGIYRPSEDADGDHRRHQCSIAHRDVRNRGALRHSRRGDIDHGRRDTPKRHRVACGQAEDWYVDSRRAQGDVPTVETS